jgi:hypothetical protein
MKRIVEAKPMADYRVWVRFEDGVEGIADLSRHAGRGVFKLWAQPGAFAQVRIGPNGELVWGDQIDFCPDALYLEITGRKPEELFPKVGRIPACA